MVQTGPLLKALRSVPNSLMHKRLASMLASIACLTPAWSPAQNVPPVYRGQVYHAPAPASPIGRLPPGPLYRASDLKGMGNRTFTMPTYLIGEFVYLGRVDGRDVFRDFTVIRDRPFSGRRRPTGPFQNLALGQVEVVVRFHHNFPPSLRPGDAIKPNPKDPLALQSVRHTANGEIHVISDSWSKP